MKAFLSLLFLLTTTTAAWSIASYYGDSVGCRFADYKLWHYITHNGEDKSDCIELGVGGDNNECFIYSGDHGLDQRDCEKDAPLDIPTELSVLNSTYCDVYLAPQRGRGGERFGQRTACARDLKPVQLTPLTEKCRSGVEEGDWRGPGNEGKRVYVQCSDKNPAIEQVD
ncbi:MAG: hypothetical protein Q9210_006734 [Variospora velana]